MEGSWRGISRVVECAYRCLASGTKKPVQRPGIIWRESEEEERRENSYLSHFYLVKVRIRTISIMDFAHISSSAWIVVF